MAYSKISSTSDVTFTINEFGRVKTINSTEMIKNILLYILFSKPGEYPSLPFIGIDIESFLYNNYNDIDENYIINRVVASCEALREFFDDGTIVIKKMMYKDVPSLFIGVSMTSTDDMKSVNSIDDTYMIGITYDELNNMIYNIETKVG